MGKKIRILSIDGGGIRGVIPGVVLMQVEKIIQEKTNKPSAKLADYFDFFAGTSTGGILAGIYLCPDEKDPSKPRFTAEQAVELYLRRGPAIFNSSAWKRFTSLGGLNEEKYSEQVLETYLRAYFRDIKLSELVKPCLIAAYEIERRHPYFFSRDDARQYLDRDFYIRDVARATSAAPIYFKASQISSMSGNLLSFVDGGLVANNPAYPDFEQVRAYELFARENRELAFVRAVRRPGGESEFSRLREYTKDDEYRSIDWKATARRQKLVAREYQLESNQNVLFALDAGRMMTAESQGLSQFDHALNASLMLAHVASRTGDQVGLVGFADRIQRFVRPQGGKGATQRLIRAAYDLHPTLVESDYQRALSYVALEQRKRALIIVFTQVVDSAVVRALLDGTRALVKHHLPLIVLFRDLDLDALLEETDVRPRALYAKGAAAELWRFRQTFISDLRRAGAMVLDAKPRELTSSLINTYLEVKARHLL